MNKTVRILLAVGFLAAVALAGVLVNQAADRFVELEKPTLTAAYTSDAGEAATYEVPDVATIWEVWDAEKGEPVLETAKYGRTQLDRVLDNQLRIGAPTVTLTLTGSAVPDDIMITTAPDSLYALVDGRAVAQDHDVVEADWSVAGDTRTCRIQVEENRTYAVAAYYGEAFVVFQFLMGGPSEEPDYNLIGYIVSFSGAPKDMFPLDGIEWITLEDTARIAQLGLDPDEDMPGGFYLYNAFADTVDLEYNEDTVFYVLDTEGTSGAGLREVSVSEFAAYWVESIQAGRGYLLCRIDEELGVVKTVAEQYLP